MEGWRWRAGRWLTLASELRPKGIYTRSRPERARSLFAKRPGMAIMIRKTPDGGPKIAPWMEDVAFTRRCEVSSFGFCCCCWWWWWRWCRSRADGQLLTNLLGAADPCRAQCPQNLHVGLQGLACYVESEIDWRWARDGTALCLPGLAEMNKAHDVSPDERKQLILIDQRCRLNNLKRGGRDWRREETGEKVQPSPATA
ncbi:hypothetical protein BC826DRAFT_968085 [Russula brevipes]|nr:hypothetical protein BC826DRAFT_968085 [Russula brevipes]